MGVRRGAQTERLPYVPALDGVRAIAVIAVFLFHTGHLSGGFLGVDLFFALSGYLITGLLLLEGNDTGTIQLGAFWLRRARRLVPALLLVVLATFVAVGLVHSFESSAAYGSDAVTSALYVANWHAVVVQRPVVSPYVHTWSLAIEVQFYLVWPLVVLLCQRGARGATELVRRRVLVVALVGAATSTALSVLLHDGPDTVARVFYGTDTHATPILLGCALAAAPAWIHRADPIRRASVGTMALIGIVGCWLVVHRDDPELYESLQAAAFALLAALLLWSLTPAVAQRSWFDRAFAVPPLRQLGIISYGVYLWHWPVVYLTPPDRLDIGEWPRLAVQASLTIAIATASYLFVEEPIRRGQWPRRISGS